MLLVSYEFLAFLALLLLLYYLLPGRWQWPLLLLASALFYLSGGGFGICFLILTTTTTWFLGIQIDRITETSKQQIKQQGLKGDEKKQFNRRVKAKQRRLMTAGLVLNFGILAVIKYTNFCIDNLNGIIHLLGSESHIEGVQWLFPLGISYYTFQAMGYLIDLYYRKYRAERNLGHVALFLSFFPQMVSGPISQFEELGGQLFTPHCFDMTQIKAGLSRMLWGYFKKLVVADRISIPVQNVIQNSEHYDGIYAVIGMIAYTLWLFADFSGGIDIVLGTAEAFGIHLPENFDRPFFSKSLAEFWRRWHMSLMRWFRQYIFYPVSVSHVVQKITSFVQKKVSQSLAKKVPVYLATITVWLITGIWHGASWRFIAWGMTNCVVVLAAQELEPVFRRFHKKYAWSNGRCFQYFAVLRTFLIFSMLNLFQSYSFAESLDRMLMIPSVFLLNQLWDGRLAELGLMSAEWLVLLCGLGLMLIVDLKSRCGSVREQIRARSGVQRYLIWFGLFLAVLIFGIYGQGYDASRFIYNQF